MYSKLEDAEVSVDRRWDPGSFCPARGNQRRIRLGGKAGKGASLEKGSPRLNPRSPEIEQAVPEETFNTGPLFLPLPLYLPSGITILKLRLFALLSFLPRFAFILTRQPVLSELG